MNRSPLRCCASRSLGQQCIHPADRATNRLSLHLAANRTPGFHVASMRVGQSANERRAPLTETRFPHLVCELGSFEKPGPAQCRTVMTQAASSSQWPFAPFPAPLRQGSGRSSGLHAHFAYPYRLPEMSPETLRQCLVSTRLRSKSPS